MRLGHGAPSRPLPALAQGEQCDLDGWHLTHGSRLVKDHRGRSVALAADA